MGERTRHDQTVSQRLLRELSAPDSPLPLPDEAARREVLVEFLTEERRAVGHRLQRIELQAARIAAKFEGYTAGRLSKDRLIAEISLAAHLLSQELLYDELAALTAD